MLTWCAALPTHAADRPAPQEMLRDWYYLMNELVRHTATYSPPVASRSFGYLGVTAFEAAVGGSDKLVSLVGQLHGLDSVPPREAGAVYDETIVDQRRDVGRDRLLFRQYRSDRAARDQGCADQVAGAGRRWRPRRRRGAQRGLRQGDGRQHPRMVAGRWRRGHHQYGLPAKNGICPRATTNGCRPARSASSSCRCCPNGATTAPLSCPSGATCATPGNPPFSTEPDSQFYKEANEVYETVKNATPEQMAIARFWSDDPMLSMTPPGHWVSIALQVAERANLSLEDNVDLLARMGVAMSDAFVGCWHEKYVYNLIRPITYIKKDIDPKWEPILNTPPFPEYPSGHSTVSGAMDAVMTAFFGENYAFEDKTGSPDGRNPRNFKSFHEAAEEAGISRLYGGIHFRVRHRGRPGAGALHRRTTQSHSRRGNDHAPRVFRTRTSRLRLPALPPRSPRRSRRVIPSFVEETASAGIDSVYDGEWEYMVGGGVATFDCNGDGYPDMLLAGGEAAGEVLSQCQRSRAAR